MPTFRKASYGKQGECVVVVSGQTGTGNKVLFIQIQRRLSPVRLPKVQRKVHEVLNCFTGLLLELLGAPECLKCVLVSIQTGEGHAEIGPRACPLSIDRDGATGVSFARNGIALI